MTQGRLYYLIGTSGSGKDSLIRYARRHLGDTRWIAFARRYITRPADIGDEQHICLSTEEFAQMRKAGAFAMVWHSHGLQYGIGAGIRQWLAEGRQVVMNGSRAYLAKARCDFPQLTPILVQVPRAQLEARLRRRGREAAEQIRRRLERGARLDRAIADPRLITICNDGELHQAGERLVRILCGETSCKSSF